MANQAVPQYYRKAYQNFAGGLNTLQNPLIISENEFAQLDNAQVNQTGLLETAPGYTTDSSPFPGTADSFIRMLVNFKRGTTVNNLIAAASDASNTNATFKVDVKQSTGNGVWSYIGHTTGTATFAASTAVTGAGTSWSTQLKAGDKIKNTQDADSFYVEISVVNSDTSLTLTGSYAGTTGSGKTYNARIILNNNQIPQAIPFNNLLIISNGSDSMYSWDNSTTNLLSQAPKARFLCTYRNRVFAANTSGGPSTVYWSYAFDQTTWDSTANSPIFPQDNGNIVNISSFANSIIVFKDNGKIYQILGNFSQTAIGQPDYLSQIDVPDNIGVIAGYSVVQNDAGKLVFLAQTGIYTMDQGLNFQKISWDINSDILNTVLTSGLVISKAYTYGSVAQFGTGTFSGTVARSTNGLQAYFDTNTIGTAYSQATNGFTSALYSTAIASDNTQHAFTCTSAVVRAPGGGGTTRGNQITHTTINTDGTTSTETIPINQDSNGIYPFINGISAAIASNGTIGVAWVCYYAADGKNRASYIENISGVWQTQTDLKTGTNTGSNSYYQSPHLLYSNTDPRIVFEDNEGNHLIYVKRVTGVFSTVNVATIGTSSLTEPVHVEMVLNASLNPRIIWGPDLSNSQVDSTLRAYKSDNDGTSWTAYTTITHTTYSRGCTVDESGNFNSLFTTTADGTNVLRNRNWDTSTTTTKETLTAGYTVAPVGFIRTNNTDYIYEIVKDTSGVYTEKFVTTYPAWITSTVYAVGNVVTNSGNMYYCLVAHTAGTFATDLANNKWVLLGATSTSISSSINSPTIESFPANNSVFLLNGNVFVTALLSANVARVIFRRLSFVSNWLGAKQSDSTLTLWNTFAVSGEVDNGNTTLFRLGLGSTSTLSAPVAITTGQQVSSDATQIFNQPWAIFWLNAFAAPTISTIVLNYQGTGAGACMPTAFIFNNEMYTSVGENGATQNNKILFLDRNNAWGTRPYPVLFMCRFNYQLYGGSSLKGDVYHLANGYTSNGASFNVTAVSKEDLLGSLELQKEVYKVYVIYQLQSSGTFQFNYRVDNFATQGGSAWNTTTIDATQNGIAEVPITTGALKSIQFQIIQSTAGNSLGIVGWVIMYSYLNVR